MEVDYASALQQLESMFPNFDDETFRTVLASNDGHLERTIEDLIKLSNEVENAPDDDENLFAEPTRKQNVSNRFSDPTYQSNRATKNAQESEDARMAYELQMQYMQENQNGGGQNARSGQPYDNTNYASHTGSYGSHNVAGSYDGVQGFPPMNAQQSDSGKKKGFYKKVKLAVKNMLTRKGKTGKKGPTRNPGLYAAMDENLNPNNQIEDEPDLFKVKEDDDAPAMKLSDVMNRKHNEEDAYSPREEYINQRSYDNNARYENNHRDEYPRTEYPVVNRRNENEFYSDNYYDQH